MSPGVSAEGAPNELKKGTRKVRSINPNPYRVREKKGDAKRVWTEKKKEEKGDIEYCFPFFGFG